MANIKSAIKRVQIAERNRLRNKSYKSAVKTLIKKCVTSAEQYGSNPTPELKEEIHNRLNAAYSKIDKAVKCGVIHANNAARKKSNLARVVKQHELAQSAAS